MMMVVVDVSELQLCVSRNESVMYEDAHESEGLREHKVGEDNCPDSEHDAVPFTITAITPDAKPRAHITQVRSTVHSQRLKMRVGLKRR